MIPLFIPILFLPIFALDNPEPLGYVRYEPMHVHNVSRPNNYIFITQDYQPYTHGYYPADGSEFWDEQGS